MFSVRDAGTGPDIFRSMLIIKTDGSFYPETEILAPDSGPTASPVFV